MLSPLATSGLGRLPTIATTDSHMLETAEGGIQDWQPTDELCAFNCMSLRTNRKLTNFLAFLSSNPLDDRTHNLYLPLGVGSCVDLWKGIVLSCFCSLCLSARGDIENQTCGSGPDLVVFFKQLRYCEVGELLAEWARC